MVTTWEDIKGSQKGHEQKRHFFRVPQRSQSWKHTTLGVCEDAEFKAWNQQMGGTYATVESLEAGEICDQVLIS